MSFSDDFLSDLKQTVAADVDIYGRAVAVLFDEDVDEARLDEICADLGDILEWPVASCATLERMPEVHLD